MKLTFSALVVIASINIACSKYKSPEINQGLGVEQAGLYLDQYDPIKDLGQYNLPGMTVKPKRYWNCVEVIGVGSKNEIGQTEKIRGLQYHLLAQSVAGLANKAVQEGRSEVGVWLNDHTGSSTYRAAKQDLTSMNIMEQGMQSGIELATNDYGPSDGIALNLKSLFSGYVLTDVVNNPESAIVASVASSVLNAIIVDVRDKAFYESAGYTMKYDARTKTTKDAWDEFKNKVSKKALVVMPVQTGEMRDFAITNNLFVININKKYATSTGGQNLALYEEILRSLDPGAPVYGWEQGIGEEVFVSKASMFGHPFIPSDWLYNLPLLSINYKARQQSILSKNINPQFIDWKKDGNFTSYWLTDGDNVQWMMGGFMSEYYTNPDAVAVKMGFGIPSHDLSQMSPSTYNTILSSQNNNTTLIESLGGGYLYTDNFGQSDARAARLKQQAANVGANMRQHRIKILGLISQNTGFDNNKDAYQAFVDENDQLEGIVTIGFDPYANGKGDIFWIKNKKGYEIPVVTVKYSIWNFGNRNLENQGTPAYLASKLKASTDKKFSLVAVHAWSSFKNTGNSTDLLGENNGGSLKGASAAKLMQGHLGTDYNVVNPQELIWRIRKHYKPEQTDKYLKLYY